jgi:two-component system, OmpR family, osmolarity sensor histidine kinase EnvZ
MGNLLKNYLPRSLFGRAVLIIVTPLVLLQIVSAYVFYRSHWETVSERLARGLAGEVAVLVELMNDSRTPDERHGVAALAASAFALEVHFKDGEILANAAERASGRVDDDFLRFLSETISRPFKVDAESLERHVVVSVQLTDGVMDVIANRKRLFSSTTYVFVLWMTGTSLILFGVAAIFMRNQVRPIRRLAAAADNFGKGRDAAPSFKPEGATEVRRAAAAFLAMRDRIQRQITQRTEMLAGVSHDLRTPITRMKLQIEMLGAVKGVEHLKGDLAEMERMLDAYLAFARGEGDEQPAATNLSTMLGDVVTQARRNGALIDLHTEGDIVVPVRPNAFKRCVTNLVENADRYAEHVSVRAGKRGETVEITVDDDGPGIPEDKREAAFRPFYRLENSRNQKTGGVGLGLTIARDVIRGHGGEIVLGESPAGGLRARVVLPI